MCVHVSDTKMFVFCSCFLDHNGEKCLDKDVITRGVVDWGHTQNNGDLA